ncbi:MAG: hypothetical protein H8E20_14325 [Verrucomicrobia bacterium]|nr:hypothetical protein [Verrucomicrobiota bacterium]
MNKINEYPKIIAERIGDAYLVQTGETTGFVASYEYQRRYEDNQIDSILARGYWDEVENPPPKMEVIYSYKLVKG